MGLFGRKKKAEEEILELSKFKLMDSGEVQKLVEKTNLMNEILVKHGSFFGQLETEFNKMVSVLDFYKKRIEQLEERVTELEKSSSSGEGASVGEPAESRLDSVKRWKLKLEQVGNNESKTLNDEMQSLREEIKG